MEPPNKGHIGDNIHMAVLSFVERLSAFGSSKRIRTYYRRNKFGGDNFCDLDLHVLKYILKI